jgi:hypothetical protein
MQRRVAELLALIGKALLFLIVDLLLGVAGVIRAVEGSHTSAYVFGILTALLFATICLWVAYRALGERDAIPHERAVAASEGDTHIHAEAGSTIIVQNHPGEPQEGKR